MSFRELIEALSPDEIEKITGRKPKAVYTPKALSLSIALTVKRL